MIIDQPFLITLAQELNERLHFAFPNFDYTNQNTIDNIKQYVVTYVNSEYQMNPIDIAPKFELIIDPNANDFLLMPKLLSRLNTNFN